jgi:hypothetical protein
LGWIRHARPAFGSFVIGGRVFGRHCVVDRVPANLLAALADLMKWLDAANMPSMVIGGVAASLLGRPRLTQDADALAILPRSCPMRYPLQPVTESFLALKVRSTSRAVAVSF